MKCLYNNCHHSGASYGSHKGFCSSYCKSKYEEDNKPRDNSSPIWDIGMVNSFDTSSSFDSSPSYDPGSSSSDSFSGGGGSFDGGGSSGDW